MEFKWKVGFNFVKIVYRARSCRRPVKYPWKTAVQCLPASISLFILLIILCICSGYMLTSETKLMTRN